MSSLEYEYDGNGWVSVRFEYDKEFIDDIKSTIAPRERRWDSFERRWTIRITSWGTFSAMAEAFEYDFYLTGRPVPGAQHFSPAGATGKTTNAPLETLFLLPGAPAELIKAAYRVLAQMYHPDKGGDHVKMKLINAAYEKLLRGNDDR